MESTQPKPKSVIYEFRFSCKCGGQITLGNRFHGGEGMYGGKTFWFRCDSCGQEGRASFVKESIFVPEGSPQQEGMTPQEIKVKIEGIVEKALEEVKEHAEAEKEQSG